MQPQFRAELVTRFTIILLTHERSTQGDIIAFSRGINGDRALQKLDGFAVTQGLARWRGEDIVRRRESRRDGN
jgi:hypothetical protein